MNDPEATAIILSLAAIDKIGPVRIKTLLAQAESPAEILEWDRARICDVPGISDELASQIKGNLNLDYGNKLVEWAGDRGFDIKTIVDADYPRPLYELYDSPPFLFISGSLSETDAAAVAIVGSRSATDYGKTTASSLAGELSCHGVTIVSGMAVGVDSAAHRGALDAGGRTIAVLGSGIDVIYPRENKGLYHRICENGAVISEFYPGTIPEPGHFPRRNRLISGLSQAVVVVEAGSKSGALLTADLALSQEKALFAVPGHLSSRLSSGTNELIKAGAELLTSVEDIFSVLPQLKKDYIAPGKKVADDLTEGENLVFQHLSSMPMQLDSLVRECGLAVSETTTYLLSLELRGLVRQLSGRRFIAV